MQENRPTHDTAEQSGSGGLALHDDGLRSEEIHLRNHDHRQAYDLEVAVVGPDGETAFEERYYLLPGQTASESGVVPGGEYEVRVTLDNHHREALACRIDPSPARTAVVEVGNGALSLTEGLQG